MSYHTRYSIFMHKICAPTISMGSLPFSCFSQHHRVGRYVKVWTDHRQSPLKVPYRPFLVWLPLGFIYIYMSSQHHHLSFIPSTWLVYVCQIPESSLTFFYPYSTPQLGIELKISLGMMMINTDQ